MCLVYSTWYKFNFVFSLVFAGDELKEAVIDEFIVEIWLHVEHCFTNPYIKRLSSSYIKKPLILLSTRLADIFGFEIICNVCCIIASVSFLNYTKNYAVSIFII